MQAYAVAILFLCGSLLLEASEDRLALPVACPWLSPFSHSRGQRAPMVTDEPQILLK